MRHMAMALQKARPPRWALTLIDKNQTPLESVFAAAAGSRPAGAEKEAEEDILSSCEAEEFCPRTPTPIAALAEEEKDSGEARP